MSKLCEKITNNHKPNFQNKFCLLYFLYVIISVLRTADWQNDNISPYLKILMFLIIGITFLCFCFDEFINKKRLEMSFLLAILCGLCFLQRANTLNIMAFLIFAITAYSLDSKEIIKANINAQVLGVLLILLLWFIGILPNRIETRISGGEEVSRYYLGFTYTTFLANYFFHIVVFYFFYKSLCKKEKISLFETVIVLSINYLIYVLTNTRAVLACIVLLILGIWIYRFYPKVSQWKLFRFFNVASFPLFGSIIFFMTYLYSPDNKFLLKINKALSGRLALGRKGFDLYGIKLFGNKTEWISYQIVEETGQTYFYVDSSYLNILFSYGLVMLLFFCFTMIILAKNNYKERNYVACFALMILFLHCMLDPQFFDIKYNPLLCLTFKLAYDYFKEGNLFKKLRLRLN